MISAVRSNPPIKQETGTEVLDKTYQESLIYQESKSVSVSYEEITGDQVSISRFESHSSVSRFMSHVRSEAGGMFVPDESDDYGGYLGLDSPAGIAGKILSRIENLFWGNLNNTNSSEAGISPEKQPLNDSGEMKNDATEEVPPVQAEPGVKNTTPDSGQSVEEPSDSVEPAGIKENTVSANPVVQEETEKNDSVPLTSVLGFIENKFDLSYQKVAREDPEPHGYHDMKDLDETRSHIKNGIRDLHDRAQGENKHVTRSLAASVGYMESRDFNLEIMTQDGDIINLVIGNSLKSGMAFNAEFNQGDFAYSSLQFGYLNENLQFSVDGDLDEDELKALSEFLSEIGDLTDTFFSKGSEDAFTQAMNLGFNSEELASFSLDLSKETSYYSSMSYLETSGPDKSQQNSFNGPDSLKQLGKMADKTEELMNHPSKRAMRHPEKFIHNLFKEMADLQNEKKVHEEKPALFDISEFGLSYLKQLINLVDRGSGETGTQPDEAKPEDEIETKSIV